MTTMTYDQQIALLEETKQSAHNIAAHAKAVSRSLARMDPMMSAMFSNTAEDTDDLITQIDMLIESVQSRKQLTLDSVFRTLVVVADDDAPTWEDQFEIDEYKLCDPNGDQLRFRVIGADQ